MHLPVGRLILLERKPCADISDAGFFAAHLARRVDREVASTSEFDVV